MSNVPASPLDRFQLYLGDREHAFLLSISATLSGRLDLHRLTVAAEKTADANPELRFRYRGGETSGSFVAGEEKIPIALSHKTRDQVITKLSSIHDPLFTITVCRNETDTIVFSAAHLLTDARGLLQIAATIADQYRDAEKNAGEDTFRRGSET